VDDDETSDEESADDVNSNDDAPTRKKAKTMKRPASSKKWDWSDDDSDDTERSPMTESGDSDLDDDDLKRDKNFASWFKDNEHLLTADHT